MKYTEEELKNWWAARCSVCDWRGLSRDCHGGSSIADTGDFTDPLCPACAQKGQFATVIDDDGEEDVKPFFRMPSSNFWHIASLIVSGMALGLSLATFLLRHGF